MDYSVLVDALRSYNKTSGYATRMRAAADAIVALQSDLAAANELINRYSQERAPEALVTVAKDRDRHFQRAERAEADLAAARANLEIAECALLAHGYRKSCDIPACNCGDQWHHGGNAVARLVEIRDAISERESFKNNGKTILQCVKECVRSDIDLTEARARVEKLEGAEEDRDEYQRQAKLYAERCAESDIELAAARALLGEARGIVHAYLRGLPNSDAGELMDRIDAALAGEKK